MKYLCRKKKKRNGGGAIVILASTQQKKKLLGSAVFLALGLRHKYATFFFFNPYSLLVFSVPLRVMVLLLLQLSEIP